MEEKIGWLARAWVWLLAERCPTCNGKPAVWIVGPVKNPKKSDELLEGHGDMRTVCCACTKCGVPRYTIDGVPVPAAMRAVRAWNNAVFQQYFIKTGEELGVQPASMGAARRELHQLREAHARDQEYIRDLRRQLKAKTEEAEASEHLLNTEIEIKENLRKRLRDEEEASAALEEDCRAMEARLTAASINGIMQISKDSPGRNRDIVALAMALHALAGERRTAPGYSSARDGEDLRVQAAQIAVETYRLHVTSGGMANEILRASGDSVGWGEAESLARALKPLVDSACGFGDDSWQEFQNMAAAAAINLGTYRNAAAEREKALRMKKEPEKSEKE